MDWLEILSGTLLVAAAHGILPNGSLVQHLTLQTAMSFWYERFLDKNGWSWKDVAWRNGTATLIEITIHF